MLLAQELLQHIHKKTRRDNIVVKLDMMKAFDKVSWVFLRRLLEKFEFLPQFIHLIMNTLSTSYFLILINGSPGVFFQIYSWV